MNLDQASGVDRAGGPGLYVAAVSSGNNFRVGDRIVAVNGTEVATCGQMREIIEACRVGDVVDVTVLRDGERVGLGVPLTQTDVPAA